MKNITLSADEALIEEARSAAREQPSTLNQLFREWRAETMRLVRWPRCHILPSIALQQAALEARQLTQYRYYDCLILASALASGARTLYSEDLQHGRSFGGLSIENPFASMRPLAAQGIVEVHL